MGFKPNGIWLDHFGRVREYFGRVQEYFGRVNLGRVNFAESEWSGRMTEYDLGRVNLGRVVIRSEISLIHQPRRMKYGVYSCPFLLISEKQK